jgi:hypothetical protein
MPDSVSARREGTLRRPANAARHKAPGAGERAAWFSHCIKSPEALTSPVVTSPTSEAGQGRYRRRRKRNALRRFILVALGALFLTGMFFLIISQLDRPSPPPLPAAPVSGDDNSAVQYK